MAETSAGRTHGILHPQAVGDVFDMTRHEPGPGVAYFIQHYWIIEWDLRRRPPHIQETLPHPCVNLVFEQVQPGIFGVSSGKYVRRLDAHGKVFAAKFRPGAFYPFLQRPVSQITDNARALQEVFGPDILALHEALLAEREREAMVALFEAFLEPRLPPHDPTVALVDAVVERIMADRTIARVEDIAGQIGLSTRQLQRLFSQYVGVSPKWVIRHARLQEAAETLAAGQADLAQLALELGYFDQAHFVKDFKAVIGTPPAEYARRNGRPA